jgi:hypothetical protein
MHDRAHLAALLTRAAVIEAARQRAAKAGDTVAETACERELEGLRRAYYAAASEGASRGRSGSESVRGA